MATTIRSTALDFNSIKNNLKTFLANKDEFKDYNFEASALNNILDVLAHNTHMNGLIANFALNESYLPTAQLRSSLVSLAEGIGYVPDTETASQAKIRITTTLTSAAAPSVITLPAFSKFTTTVDDIQYSFQTTQSLSAENNGSGFYEFKTASGSNEISIFEGTFKTKTFLVGEYEDNPVYVIPDTKLDSGTVTVKVYESALAAAFTPYQNIVNASTISANSTVYVLKESPNGYYELSFGDGETFGVAPAAGNRIEVEYLSTKGSVANGASSFSPSSTLSVTLTDNTTANATLSVSTWYNSTGGKAKETLESIRQNAPFQYASQNRMVTAEDYTSLILRTYSTLIKDIVSWGGEDALVPEYGAVYTSIAFEDGVSAQTIADTKISINSLADQLALVSYKLRFIDPIKTYVEVDVYFQYNPRLTDLTVSGITSSVKSTVNTYFAEKTGKFKQSFRRSNMLANIDDISTAILSSRANVRMQQRFTPSAPTVGNTVKGLLDSPAAVSNTTLDYVVRLIMKGRYADAANYLIVNNYVSFYTYTQILDVITKVKKDLKQELLFPTSIAIPDDDTYSITSSEFTYNGFSCTVKNKLSSNTLQIVDTSNNVVVDNIGSYNSTTGRVTLNFFTPSRISGNVSYVKLSAVPANPSAISPDRNEFLEYDETGSTFNPVSVNVLN